MSIVELVDALFAALDAGDDVKAAEALERLDRWRLLLKLELEEAVA